MKALLFGSIGTLIETSELQRHAFNMAFAAHGLEWHWDRDAYRKMLKDAGGADRVMRYADARGEQVDAGRIHQAKSRIFQTALIHGRLPLRPGVPEALRHARESGVMLGFITTTSRANVDAVLEAAASSGVVEIFDRITSRADVSAPKPNPECYTQVMAELGLPANEIAVIEDNADGVAAAVAAGLRPIAFMGKNTRDHAVPDALSVQTDRLDLSVLDTPEAAA
ncbi:HAD-IA family hydrolase [Cognatishimia sp. MH4019]|uniref:HAD-IA family hydrolase n=1 Tax=Cognatishimia sp. MH4019 TaxID=2854030 RepID=UPI001CD4B521|nr:HAD-IA family hydrolase [Cognatishimia sp. MH4019]